MQAELCLPFIDAPASSALFRAFHVPVLGESRTIFNKYCLLRRV